MKLLVLTQTVDVEHPALGFFHGWLMALSKRVSPLTVICLKKGMSTLPPSVKVLSLGKEQGVGRISYLFHFYVYIWKFRRDYDTVFVHMNPEYVVLGGLLWRLLGKKIVLWYTHRQVSLRLRIAARLAHTILTAAPESFQIKSSKVKVVGHGIDLEMFVGNRADSFKPPLTLISVGRITPIKNQDVLIEAVSRLMRDGVEVEAIIVGDPAVASDRMYFETLTALVKKSSLENKIKFIGAVSYREMPELYKKADISVNATPTGGIDKAVLESMASGTLPLTSNKAFEKYFGPYSNQLIFSEKDPVDLAEKIKALSIAKNSHEIRGFLQDKVLKEAGVDHIVEKIVASL